MKKLFPLLCVLGGCASSALSSSVVLSGSPFAPRIISSTGALIGNGKLIRVGYFALAGDWSSFVEFGSTFSMTSATLNSRIVANPMPNNNGEADDSAFNGSVIYLWIYNATFADPTAEQVVCTASAASAAAWSSDAWIFPVDGGPLDIAHLEPDAIDLVYNVPGKVGAAVVPNGAPGITGFVPAIRLGSIPEPSSIALWVFFGLAQFKRHRF